MEDTYYLYTLPTTSAQHPQYVCSMSAHGVVESIEAIEIDDESHQHHSFLFIPKAIGNTQIVIQQVEHESAQDCARFTLVVTDEGKLVYHEGGPTSSNRFKTVMRVKWKCSNCKKENTDSYCTHCGKERN